MITNRYTLNVNGVTRAYYVFRPSGPSPKKLIIALHGGGGEPDRFVTRVGLDDLASEINAIVIAPEGLSDTWRYGGTMTRQAERNSGDDIAFFSALSTKVIPSLGTTEVHLVGISAGGMMAYRVACERPGGLKVNSLSVVASTKNVNGPAPSGVHLLHIHHKDDQNVPYLGGSGVDSARGANYRCVEDGLYEFAEANASSGDFSQTKINDYADIYTFDCPNSTEVSLIYLHKYVEKPHYWFTDPILNATAQIKRFLLSH